MKAFLALAATSLALVISGCAAGDEPATVPSVPENTDSISDGGLGAKLLTESDLPAGYTEIQLPTIKGGLGAMVGCPALDVRPSELTGEASVSFTSGTAGNLINETVRLVSADGGRKALADLAAMPKQCGNAKTANMPAMGSESTAVELTATPPELGITVNGYLIGIRDEQTMVVIVFVSPGKADPIAAQAVAKTAWERATPK